MKVLNLDKSFNPFLYGRSQWNFDNVDFPSEFEPQIKLKIEDAPSGLTENKDTLITCRIQSANDIMRLLMATDALRRNGVERIELFIPFLPYARQDRIMTSGEPFSLKVMAELINSQGYDKVGIYDAHSDVAFGAIDRSFPIANTSFIVRVWDFIGNKDLLIARPDAGSGKKVNKVADALDYKHEIVPCEKIRDVNDKGKIKEVRVYVDDLKGQDVLIPDDICDGGATFSMLGEVLKKKNAGKLYLAVTHGLFTRGLTKLLDKSITYNRMASSPMDLDSNTSMADNCGGHYDKIFCTDSIRNLGDYGFSPELNEHLLQIRIADLPHIDKGFNI